jgi:hypothetical protein
MKYWILIALFTGIYLGMFTVSFIEEGQEPHSYSCHTDQECYEECVAVGDYPCE